MSIIFISLCVSNLLPNLICRSNLIAGDSVINAFERTSFLFFCISLAMYLYNVLIECSYYVKISIH